MECKSLRVWLAEPVPCRMVEWLTTYLNNHITTITPATPHPASIAAPSTICHALLYCNIHVPQLLEHYSYKHFYRSRYWVYVQLRLTFSIFLGFFRRQNQRPLYLPGCVYLSDLRHLRGYIFSLMYWKFGKCMYVLSTYAFHTWYILKV